MFHVVQLNPPEPDGVVVTVTATGGRHLRTRTRDQIMTTHIMPRRGRLPPNIGMRASVSPLGPETSREHSQ
jgi:hypothetical protein